MADVMQRSWGSIGLNSITLTYLIKNGRSHKQLVSDIYSGVDRSGDLPIAITSIESELFLQALWCTAQH